MVFFFIIHDLLLLFVGKDFTKVLKGYLFQDLKAYAESIRFLLAGYFAGLITWIGWKNRAVLLEFSEAGFFLFVSKMFRRKN
jgi:hypothetical protein